MDRLCLLQEWLQNLPTTQNLTLSLDITSMQPASSDASFRRYFRLLNTTGDASYIVMDAPPPLEDVRPFMYVAELFAKNGAHVPKILASDDAQGFLLLSDFGQTTYLHMLQQDRQQAKKLYDLAIDGLLNIQLHSKADTLPLYDAQKLYDEMQLFIDWYLIKHLQYPISALEQKQLADIFQAIIDNNMQQTHVYVHRDYHSRNLMYVDQTVPYAGILDFQDALYGPITYDLVSLWRDAYIEWDEEVQLDFLANYWQKAKNQGLQLPSFDQFYIDYEWMGMQRHLKVLGIFARLYHRDQKDGYLSNIPLVKAYVQKTAKRYAVFAPLAHIANTA